MVNEDKVNGFQELNDTLSITEVFFLKLINLVQSTLKGLICEFASFGVVLHHFIMEDGEVEGQTKFNRVACRESYFVSCVIRV